MPHFECGAFNHSATSPKGRRRAAKNPRARMAEPDNMRRRAGSSASVAQGSKIPTTQKDGGRVAFSAELNIVRLAGGVAEWLKAHAWKVCIRETVSRVRIPPPPPAHIHGGADSYYRARHKDPRAGEHPRRIHIRFILSWLNTSYQRGGAFVPAL